MNNFNLNWMSVLSLLAHPDTPAVPVLPSVSVNPFRRTLLESPAVSNRNSGQNAVPASEEHMHEEDAAESVGCPQIYTAEPETAGGYPVIPCSRPAHGS